MILAQQHKHIPGLRTLAHRPSMAKNDGAGWVSPPGRGITGAHYGRGEIGRLEDVGARGAPSAAMVAVVMRPRPALSSRNLNRPPTQVTDCEKL